MKRPLNRVIYFVRATSKRTTIGGAEIYLSRLTNAINEKGLKYKVINSPLPNFLPSWLRVILFNTYLCVFKKNKFYFSLERLSCADIYRAGDGVHKEFLKVIKKTKINPLHSVYKILEKRCFRNSKRIIANSYFIKNEIIKNYDIDPKKISVVYNGININHDSCKDSSELTKKFSLQNKRVILFVGSGFERKGVKDLLYILSRLKSKNFLAFIVGKERRMNSYKLLANELNLDNHVIFTGPKNNVNDYYEISDIFVLPTLYEPFSNVILEAMSYFNVVFTTSQNGASEILDKNFVMKNSSDYSVAEKIDFLLNNETKLDAIKLRNYKTCQNFSIEKNLDKTLKIIDEVIN